MSRAALSFSTLVRLSNGTHQGCQIFLGPKDKKGEKCTKLPQNIPNGHKIDKMVKKYSKIFHSKTLQNFPKSGFLV
jgi:hypothetical protein